MTIKKTVQMIALSGVLAVGVSGNAMAVVKNEEWYDSRINAAIEVGDHHSAAHYRDLKNKRYGFGEIPVAVFGRSLDDMENEQRDIAAIHNAMSGIHYVFGKDDKYSISGSVGFHNASNVALAIGLSGKPVDNVMVYGSLSSSASMENVGANVGVSIAF